MCYWTVIASGALLTLPAASAAEIEMVLVKATSIELAEETDGE